MTKLREHHLYLYGANCGAIPVTFEQAAERLQELPSLTFEPDGSFVWVQAGGGEQLFGMLFDAANEIRYVELRGTFGLRAFQGIVTTITDGNHHNLAVMKLPQRQLQDLQEFEQTGFC